MARRSKLDDAIRRAVRRERRAMFAASVQTEAQLERAHNAIARRLRVSLRGKSPQQVNAAIRAALNQHIDRRIAAVGRGAQTAAEAGVSAQAATLRVAFGAGAEAVIAQTTRRATGELIRQELNRGMGQAAIDKGVKLSARFHLAAQETAMTAGRVIGTSIEAGESVVTAARFLAQTSNPVVRLPAYITDIRAAVRGSDSIALRQAIQTHTAAIEGLVDAELKAAARAFVRTAETMNVADLDRQVNHFVRDRALRHERMIARTEINRGFSQGYKRSVEDHPGVVGMKWNIAASHPAQDICDAYASQDSGMGEGVYAANSPMPDMPAHPNCLCYWTSVVDKKFARRRLARQRGTPEPPRPWETGKRETGMSWLRSQPNERVQAILGPGRFKEFQRGRNPFGNGRQAATGPALGGFKPLYKMQGRPRPVRRQGPAARITKADRLKLLDPDQRRTLLRRMSRPGRR